MTDTPDLESLALELLNIREEKKALEARGQEIRDVLLDAIPAGEPVDFNTLKVQIAERFPIDEAGLSLLYPPNEFPSMWVTKPAPMKQLKEALGEQECEDLKSTVPASRTVQVRVNQAALAKHLDNRQQPPKGSEQ